MNVAAGQLSLLDLESPSYEDEPASPLPAEHERTPDDKPAENAREEQRRAPTKGARTQRAVGDVGLLTTDEAAVRLHVHPRTVQRLVERGQLSAVHLGSAVRFDPQDVEALIAAVKERRQRSTAAVDTVRARRGATLSFADRLRSQRHEHRAAQA